MVFFKQQYDLLQFDRISEQLFGLKGLKGLKGRSITFTSVPYIDLTKKTALNDISEVYG